MKLRSGWSLGVLACLGFDLGGCGSVESDAIDAQRIDASVADSANCEDRDHDGFGVGCVRGIDCADNASSCTTSCGDLDDDGFPDCRDMCADADQDNYGVARGSTDVVGAGSVPVLDCTTNGVAPCSIDAACIAPDQDDTDPACTDGAPPFPFLCAENDLCDGNGDGLPDGTLIRCMVGVDSDLPGGGISDCVPTNRPCLFGPWSNSQCGTVGTGWHIQGGSCGTGQGGGLKRCTQVEVLPPDPCL